MVRCYMIEYGFLGLLRLSADFIRAIITNNFYVVLFGTIYFSGVYQYPDEVEMRLRFKFNDLLRMK